MKTAFWQVLFLLTCFAAPSKGDLREDLYPHTLQPTHPFYSVLDRIFASSKTLDTARDLKKAGFTIIQLRDPMFVIAKHPSLPGHLVKVHLHSSPRPIEHRWENLITRCNRAEDLRNLIKTKKLRYFIVPNKWIYTTPTEQQDPVLIVTYMDILSKQQSAYVWKNLVTRKHIKELYSVISHNCGSSKLSENMPYTTDGQFACVDTEKSSQGDHHVKAYLSKEMQDYWDHLKRKYSQKVSP